MFRAVLFDLDNTLIDFMAMKNSSCDAAIAAMIDAGLKLDHEEARKILFELYGKFGIEYQLIFNAFLKKVLGKVDYRILANAIVAYRKTRQSFTVPYPQVRSVLVELKSRGLKLGVVTDAPRLNAWLRLAEMGLTEFFDVVVTLGDSKKLKPIKATIQIENIINKQNWYFLRSEIFCKSIIPTAGKTLHKKEANCYLNLHKNNAL